MKIDEAKDTIIEMRNQGYGYKRIAKALNANPASVKRWIAKLGLPTKLESNNPETPRVIQCAECGEPVNVIRFNAKFCSDACRLRARKIKANGRKKCLRCKEFIYGLQNVSHCSDECKAIHAIAMRTIRLVKNHCVRCKCTRLARRKRSYCSDECWKEEVKERERARVIERTKCNIKCVECGKFFETTRGKAKYCGDLCNRRFSNRRKETLRRNRITANGKVDWSISIERLTNRDGKVCYLCNELINYQVHHNHNDYPSIEHVHPISKGGTHTWDNVKLAHRKCNSKKSNKILEVPQSDLTLV